MLEAAETLPIFMIVQSSIILQAHPSSSLRTDQTTGDPRHVVCAPSLYHSLFSPTLLASVIQPNGSYPSPWQQARNAKPMSGNRLHGAFRLV